MWMLAPILLVVALTGTDGQQIVLDPQRLISPCSQGLRSDIDSFTLTGTIGRNISALVQSKWETLVCLVISDSLPYDLDIAAIYVEITAEHCMRGAPLCCYCDQTNATTGSAHFGVNVIVRQERSTGKIILRWRHENGTSIYNLNTTTLPVVYDVSRASLILTVNGVKAKELSAPFGVYFVPNENNIVQLCCIGTASPCYPRIAINSKTFESQTNCVNHTIFVSTVDYAVNVTLAYSVCTETDYITAGAGVIETRPPATTSSDQGRDSLYSRDDESPWRRTIIRIVFLSSILLLVVFAIGVGVYFQKARSSNPQVSNLRTSERTTNEFDSEHHQPDSEQSELKTQPDDGRGTNEVSWGTFV